METSSGETESDVHMHVFPKKALFSSDQAKAWRSIPLNVALIMFDCTSAATF